MIWAGKERYRFRIVKTDNLSRLLFSGGLTISKGWKRVALLKGYRMGNVWTVNSLDIGQARRMVHDRMNDRGF